MRLARLCLVLLAAVGALAAFASTAAASHSWSSYHWSQASTSAPAVTVVLGDNLTATRSTDWPKLLKGSATADGWTSVVHDWSNLNLFDAGAFGDILDTPWTKGANLSNQKRCKPVSGRVEVCNARYGYNGWLGVAQIWVSGGHIGQATTKLNDSYLDGARYDAADKQHVLCQEVGHAFGLDHQDESGADLNTCMDYASDLDNAHPNAHDNEQINAIYRSHTDPTATVHTTTKASGRVKRVRKDLYVESFPDGTKVFTFVTWTGPAAAAAAPDDRVPTG